VPGGMSRDGAIVQYTNGIVDFSAGQLHRVRLRITGCPFDIPKMNPKTNRVFKCTCHGPRERRPGTGVHQIVPDGLPALRK